MFWNWISSGKPTKTLGKQKTPPKSQAFVTTVDDGSLVLGGVELTDKALVLSVNSRARSDPGRALLSEVGEPLVEMQSIEQLRRRATALRRKCRICPKKSVALSFTAVWIGTIAICLTTDPDARK